MQFPAFTEGIKGCFQFRFKPFFTPPSTLHHSKPIARNAALATPHNGNNSLLQACARLCVCVSGTAYYV